MKIKFNLSNEDLKYAELNTYNKKSYYTPIKITLSLVVAMLLLFTFIIPIKAFIMHLAFNVMFQTSSLKFLAVTILAFIIIFIFLNFFFIELLINTAINIKYLFKKKQSVRTTVIIDKETITYLNENNRFMIPWREITDISESREYYLLYASYVKKYLLIKKQPDTFSKKETKQFILAIQERISK